jgi:hypothetical protein
VKKHERLVCQLRDIDGVMATKAVLGTNHGQPVHRIQKPKPKSSVLHSHYAEVNLSMIQSTRQCDAAVFDQLNFDGRIPGTPVVEKA